MSSLADMPKRLYTVEGRINLYYLHETFRVIADLLSGYLKNSCAIDATLTAGMWGGSYLIAREDGQARTNVVRLYSLVCLPQNTPLDEKENFERLMEMYQETLKNTFGDFGLNLVDPRWGEPVPYSNGTRPTTTLQMWDATGRAKFVRLFFVWNSATWEESVIYDAIRNVRQLKENLNIDKRPLKKTSDELKFLLQDVLITYFTLRPALNPDFAEHAEPIIEELFGKFVAGLHDPAQIEDQYHKVHGNALVYGFEEALDGPYRQDGLDIFDIEKWPVEKINWVPEALRQNLVPYLKETFAKFRRTLDQQGNIETP